MQFPQEYKLDPHNTSDAILSVIELNKDIDVDAFKRFFFISLITYFFKIINF